METQAVTRVLFVDGDETTFEFRRCMARVLGQSPLLEMYHATDASSALAMIEELSPNIIVLDEDHAPECDSLLDALPEAPPTIVVQTSTTVISAGYFGSVPLTYIPKDESLAGIHQLLAFLSGATLREASTPMSLSAH